MKIVSIKYTKDCIKLLLSNGKLLEIDEDIFSNYFLYENKELSDEEYNSLLEEVSSKKEVNYCKRILNKQNYSSKQIYDKLYKNKKVSANKSKKIVSYLAEQGYINDEQFKQDYIESAYNKGYGYQRIKQKLIEFGLDVEDYIYDETLEKENIIKCCEILVKKYQSYSFSKMKESIMSSLYNLGYDYDLINWSISKIDSNLKKDDYLKCQRDYHKITFKLEKGQILEKKQKIIEKLLRLGYHYDDIKKVLEGIDQNEIY